MSFPDSNFTFNSFTSSLEGLTISNVGGKSSVNPGSPVITSYINPPTKGEPTSEQIWQAQQLPSWPYPGCYLILNPSSGLVLTIQEDSNNIIVDIPYGPKDPGQERQAWKPISDSSQPDLILVTSATGSGVITMPNGQSYEPVIVSPELPEGGRKYQLWQPTPV